jgi:hypothetical protein
MRPDLFGDAAGYVTKLQQVIAESPTEQLAIPHFMAANWMKVGDDAFGCLRDLSLGTQLSIDEAAGPAITANLFLQALVASPTDPIQRLFLLADRYSCPFNLGQSSENDIREYLLRRLMVNDRASIERDSIEAIHADDLLFTLNLIALHARSTSDLRFLDALNYYYELLPAHWVPRARHAWLAASFPGLYARALARQILRHQAIAHSDTREHTARGAAYL